MPESDDKPVVSKKAKSGDPNLVEKKEIIEKFFAIESQKLEIEKLRSQNESKELEISAKSSEEATKLAEKDLDNQKYYFSQTFDFRKNILSKAFWLTILVVLLFTGLTVYLSITNASILEKLISYGFDLIKFSIGVLLGYLFKASRKSKVEIDKE